MRYVSLFSGIEAASVAWEPLRWTPIAFAEVEPFPSAVLSHRFPNVPNLGDVTKVDWSAYRGKCNILVGGSPCQSFSVAGLRRSLDDDRGNLALAFCKITHAIDPEFVVYENVPGLLSTKDNAFGCLLAGLVGEESPLLPGPDGWADAGMAIGPERSAAWRVLDAQYFGVPQRRRRVFVVVCRTRDGINPGAILFEPESVPGNPPPSREAGTRVAGTFAARPSGGGGFGTDFETDGGLIASNGTWGTPSGGDVARPLNSPRPGAGGGGRYDLETDTIIVTGTLNANGRAAGSATQQDAESGLLVTHALRGEGFDASEDGTGRGTPLVPVAFGWQNSASQGDSVSEHITPTLDKSKTPAIAFQERGREGGRNVETQTELAYSLNAPHGGGRRQENNVCAQSGVRRLTPRECERLMGLPDDWTLVPYRGKDAVDGPRYRAIGNSIAVPCLRWIGQRIQMVHDLVTEGGQS